MSAWQSIDSVPDDGQPHLVTGWEYGDPSTGRRWRAVATCEDGVWYEGQCQSRLHPATHWMSLSDPEAAAPPTSSREP